MDLKIAWLYPDLMSTYGDRGNIICFKKRLEWRNISVEIKEISLDSKADDLRSCDLLFMGGAQDRQQKIASEDLKVNKGPVIKKMTENNIPGLFICGAYQFMGKYYKPAEGESIPGLGIFDLFTEHPGKTKPRCIGNIVVSSKILNPNSKFRIVGFENHGGRTYLGDKVKPLANVLVGYGNNGEDKTEGAVYKNAFGSYLHGPILPKNPQFADYLLKLALQKKYQDDIKLNPLDDELENKAKDFILEKLGVKNGS